MREEIKVNYEEFMNMHEKIDIYQRTLEEIFAIANEPKNLKDDLDLIKDFCKGCEVAIADV